MTSWKDQKDTWLWFLAHAVGGYMPLLEHEDGAAGLRSAPCLSSVLRSIPSNYPGCSRTGSP